MMDGSAGLAVGSTLFGGRKMNAMDYCCSLLVHFDTCNWDDGGNNTAQR